MKNILTPNIPTLQGNFDKNILLQIAKEYQTPIFATILTKLKNIIINSKVHLVAEKHLFVTR